MKRIIHNGKLVLRDEIVDKGYVVTEGLYIKEIGNGDAPKTIMDAMDEKIDAKGKYISPGFIDIHTHGAGGREFGIGEEDFFTLPLTTHVKYGTTSIYPTVSSATFEIMENAVHAYKDAKKKNIKGSYMRGLHFEGPYFAAAQKGAQLEKYLRNPHPDEYMKILDMTDDIKRWSGACELDGMAEFGKALTERGIKAAVGHSDASYEEVLRAKEWGFDLITHLYSGCSTITRDKGYRTAGVVEAAYLIEDMDIEIITDGHHLPDSLIQFAYKFKGADKTALITDSLAYAGMNMPNGTLLREDIMVEDGVAKLTDRSAFGGSLATFDVLVRTVLKAGIPMLDAVKMSSITPARIMGIDKITGSLEAGKEADIIVFDENINMDTVIVRGDVIH